MTEQKITTHPFPNSKKVFIPGNLHPIQVAMREISLSPTKLSNSGLEINPAVTIYDTSGPYTDVNCEIDIRKGLDRIRDQRILDRNDDEILEGISSAYGQKRLHDSSLDELRFAYNQRPKRTAERQNVTQSNYATKRIITAGMQYV